MASPPTFQPAGHAVGDLSTTSLTTELYATVALAVVLTTAFTAVRMVARRSMGPFVIEDCTFYRLQNRAVRLHTYVSFTHRLISLTPDCSIATWLIFMGYNVVVILQTIAGIGQHIWNVNPSHSPAISKLSWTIQLLYCVLIFLAKAVLLLQIQRIFAPARWGTVYIACQTLIWGNLAFYGSAFLALVVECIPLDHLWNSHVQNSRCIDLGALLIAMGAINVVSDIFILIVPLWAIFHLQINDTKRKLGLCAIFATGVLAIACSVCRLAYTLPPLRSQDSTYLFAPVALWSLAEITSIILCTCFPLIPRFNEFIRRYKKRKMTHTKTYSLEQGSDGNWRQNSHAAKIGENSSYSEVGLRSDAHESELDGVVSDEGQLLSIRRTVTVQMESCHTGKSQSTHI